MPVDAECCGFGGGGGGATLDRFAPTYLVGNVPEGDSAVPYSSGGFNYVPDLGDGAGLASALAAAAGNPGRVYFRRGTYDFGQPTSPATPITVPIAVSLQGEGHASLLRGPISGEGVLVALLGSFLSDFDVENTASKGPSVSTALVRCVDSVGVENVTIRVTTSDTQGASLREGIRFEGMGPNPTQIHTARNLFVTMLTKTIDSASTCVEVVSTILTGQTVVTLGGNRAMGLDASSVLIYSLVSFDWQNNGVLCRTSNCTVRLYNFVGFSDGSTATAKGIVLRGGGGSSLRACIIQSPGPTSLEVGIEMADPDGNNISGAEIEACIIGGVERGIVGGRLAKFRMSVNDTVITGCSIQANVAGIEFLNHQNNNLVIDGNTVAVNLVVAEFLGGTAGIHLQGRACRIVNNFVTLNYQGVFPPLADAHAIWSDGIDYGPQDPNFTQLNQIIGNNCIVNAAGYGIEVSSERTVVTGNITEASNESLGCIHLGGKLVFQTFQGVVLCIVGNNNCTQNTAIAPVADLPAPIVCEGHHCSISGNTIFYGAPVPASGIVMTASSHDSAMTGNVNDGGGAPCVADYGVLNSGVNNIGA